MTFSAYKGRGDAVLININECTNQMWGKVDSKIIDKYYNNSNISYEYAIKIANFIIEYGFPKMIKQNSNIAVNIIKNLENAYFLVRPYCKETTNKYYMRSGRNCSVTSIRNGKEQMFYLMGVCVLGKYNRIDWIQSYYTKTNTSYYILDFIIKYIGIDPIPSNIAICPSFWSKYLSKYYKIKTFDEFIKYLWKSCLSLENYYYIAFDIQGYDAIYEECNEEYINLKLLYDY